MKILCILIIFYLCSFIVSAHDVENVQDCQIIEIAEILIKEKYPLSYKEREEHEYLIENKKDTWEVSWKPRKNIAEGTPVVVISKKTLKVIKYWHYQ